MRKLEVEYTALTAKLEFMKQNFDVSNNVEKLDGRIFDEYTESNQRVNENIGDFLTKLAATKTDISRFKEDMRVETELRTTTQYY